MKTHYYETSSGKNLIYKYIEKLSLKEQVDGYTVLEYLENDEWDKVQYKQWHKKVTVKIYTVSMHAESRKIKPKRRTRRL